jgi:hypothetical protein
VVTVITAFLYWRCCRFLSSDCFICEVNMQLNAGASKKLLIWVRRGADLKTTLFVLNLKIML